MLTPIRKPLTSGFDAEVWPRLGVMFIDPSVPDEDWPELIADALRELWFGDSPYAAPLRPRLEVLEGGRGDEFADLDESG